MTIAIATVIGNPRHGLLHGLRVLIALIGNANGHRANSIILIFPIDGERSAVCICLTQSQAMSIEVTVQFNGKRIGFIIRFDSNIGTAIIGTVIFACSLDCQRFTQIGMDGIPCIPLEIQALRCQSRGQAVADRLQIADSGCILQHGVACSNGRNIYRLVLRCIIKTALYIGNLLAAIGQAVSRQFHLTIRTAALRRNGNALAVNHGSSTAHVILKGSLVQVQVLI